MKTFIVILMMIFAALMGWFTCDYIDMKQDIMYLNYRNIVVMADLDKINNRLNHNYHLIGKLYAKHPSVPAIGITEPAKLLKIIKPKFVKPDKIESCEE